MNKMEEKMINSDEVGDDSVCDDDRNDDDENDTYADMFSGNIFEFKTSHPGSKFSHLAEFKHEFIPKISLPEGEPCNIEKLCMNEEDMDKSVKQHQENYAKMALLIFYPFRTLVDLKKENSYWNLFNEQCRMHFYLDTDDKRREKLKFWCTGFDILQNIQDQNTLEKN